MNSNNPENNTQKIDFNHILMACKENLKKSKAKKPLRDIKKQLKNSQDPLNFKKALQKSKRFPVIAEFKPASPTEGNLSPGPLKNTIKLLENSGAAALSILTEKRFFKGNIDYLKAASKISSIPLLRKDFIIDKYQIYEARLYGASSILLISDIYPDISSGIEICRELGMEPLVECKNSIDIYRALNANAEIIGVNNRSFNDFSIDFLRTKSLSPLLPPDKILVAESGVKTLEDVVKLCNYGADALLIGTSIMQATNIEEFLSKILITAEKTSKNFNKRGPFSKNLISTGGFNNNV